MNDLLGWVVLAPLAGGLAGAVLWLVSRKRGASPQFTFWFDAAALVSLCAGLMVGPLVLLLADTGASFSLLDLTFSSSPVARVLLPVIHGGLLAAVFFSWDDSQEETTPRARPVWVVWAATPIATLIAGALLVGDRTLQALLLFGVALLTSGAAMSRVGTPVKADTKIEERVDLGGRLAGALKHLSMAAVATVLLVAGMTLIDRQGLSLENRSLLQLGLNLLSVGLLVRAGAMPFSGAGSDLVRATPGAAILMLGVAAPATLVAGILMLAPIEGSLVNAPQGAWIAALGVFLAGIRALGTSDFASRSAASDANGKVIPRQTQIITLPVLIAMSAAVQVGWALFGVLSGSRMGAAGAMLLAVNIAIAVPLLVISGQGGDDGSGRPRSKIGVAIGAASLLGLPPFGGFAGTLMVAQAATNIGGIWSGLLLLGALLLGVGWARAGIVAGGLNVDETTTRKSIWGVAPLLIAVLAVAQIGLFVASGQIVAALGNWAGAPWFFAP